MKSQTARLIPTDTQSTQHQSIEHKSTERKIEDSETYRELISIAGKRFDPIPAALVINHTLRVTDGTNFAVQVQVLEEISKRFRTTKSENLVLHTRPPSNKVFGEYQTKRKGLKEVRPYQTALFSVEPFLGSCSCPDFKKNSLGFCKHLGSVILKLFSQKNTAFQLKKESPIPVSLNWHPIRDFVGKGDGLEQIFWPEWKIEPNSEYAENVRRWFKLDLSGNLVLRDAYLDNPSKRLELARDLLSIAKSQRKVFPDVALQSFLEEEVRRIEQLISSKISASELKQFLKSLKLPLYPYQRDGVERFFQSGRLLLGDDMGLGKTAQSIAISHVLWNSKRIRRALVVVPASLKSQWLREWQLFSDVPAQVVEGSPEERRTLYKRTKQGVLIVNYEQVIKDLDFLLEWRPEFMILDEAQRIKNWETKTALTLKKFAPPYRLILTGTPLENRIEELCSIVEWLDSRALAPHWRFSCWHLISVDGTAQIGGMQNVDTIRSRIEHVFLRRLRKDVLGELPSRTDTRVPVSLTPLQVEMHDELSLPIARLIGIKNKRPLSQAEFLRLMQLLNSQRIISNGVEQFEFAQGWEDLKKVSHPSQKFLTGLSSPKLLELREIVSQMVIEQGRKVVIFSQWRRMLQLVDWALSGILKPAGLRSAFFSGQESPKRRTENIVAFHDDPSLRVLLATDAGGVGLNLQRAANCCINIELPWNPAVLEQRIGRIYRNGQKDPVAIYNLVSSYGIEDRLLSLVSRKQALFQGLFDGKSDEILFEESGSFLDRIKEYVSDVTVNENQEANQEENDDGNFDDKMSDEVPDLIERESETSRTSSSLPPTSVTTLASEIIAPIAPPYSLPDLFSQIKIERDSAGGMKISAPPQSAQVLADLFEGFGKLFRAGL